MKKVLRLLGIICLFAAKSEFITAQNIDSIAVKFANTITPTDLKKHLLTIASKEFEGRNTGEEGQKKAANYLQHFYKSHRISTPLKNNSYFQNIATQYLKPNIHSSENVIAFIKGAEKPNEIIVVSAHYDHLGIRHEKTYAGADDNGSGTAAILEIAEAFKEAAKNGFTPKRSIVFLHVTGEEKGLLGSKFYVKFPVFPLKNTVANLNIDMIGRTDKAHENNPNYIYLIGSDKLSTELHQISEKTNITYTKLTLDYTYNDDSDPNRFYYRSDHYNFAKNNIPIIFYFNGTHKDYHKPSDTPEKINYELLAKRTKLIFYTAWEIANRKNRVIVDKKN